MNFSIVDNTHQTYQHFSGESLSQELHIRKNVNALNKDALNPLVVYDEHVAPEGYQLDQDLYEKLIIKNNNDVEDDTLILVARIKDI